ncbi:MAG TPA: lipocalin family protein [bacterium]|nr:lipocalin family protein [bacterium]
MHTFHWKSLLVASLGSLTLAAGNAFGSDTLNLCLTNHQPPPGVPINLPEDDSPKAGTPGFPVDAWQFNGHVQTFTGHNYGFGYLFLYLPFDVLVITGNITDLDGGTYHNQTWATFGIPYVATEDGYLDIRLADTPISHNAPTVQGRAGDYRVTHQIDDVKFDLTFLNLKDPVYHNGDSFMSYIDPDTGNDVGSNYYYSRTRNALVGKVTDGGKTKVVFGEGWSERQAAIHEQGDVKMFWYAIRLDNGEELMLFDVTMRQTGAPVIRTGTRAFAPPFCGYEELTGEDFEMTTGGSWVSPETGVEYPTVFYADIPSRDIHLTLTPLLPNQEVFNTLGLFHSFYNGAATVEGTVDGQPVSGTAEVQDWIGGPPNPV